MPMKVRFADGTGSFRFDEFLDFLLHEVLPYLSQKEKCILLEFYYTSLSYLRYLK